MLAAEIKFGNLSDDYAPSFADFDDLQELGVRINAARKALFKVTEELNKRIVQLAGVSFKYESSVRRSYVTSNLKTAADRKMSAEIAAGDLEKEKIKLEAKVAELKSTAAFIKTDLEVLENVGHNLRAQMKL